MTDATAGVRPVYTPYLTRHAIERFQQRIENIPEEEIIRRVMTPKAKLQLGMGCSNVHAGDYVLVGQRGAVVTILFPKFSNAKARERKRAKSRRRASRGKHQ